MRGDRELRALQEKAQLLSTLQRHFSSVAPAYLVQSSQVLGLQSGLLSVAVGSAAQAAKLRQLAPELVVSLQNSGCEVSGIRVKVQVSFERTPSLRPPRKLGKAAQKTLNSLSQALNDSPLKLALKRLAEIEK